MENRKCGYTCCACYSLSSYSQKRLPVKYPFTVQRTFHWLNTSMSIKKDARKRLFHYSRDANISPSMS